MAAHDAKGCLELNIPMTVLADCQRLDVGQKIELFGSSCKKGSKESSNKDPVKICAEKQESVLSFSLEAASMGTVFKRKMNDIWQCDIAFGEIMQPSEVQDFETEDSAEYHDFPADDTTEHEDFQMENLKTEHSLENGVGPVDVPQNQLHTNVRNVKIEVDDIQSDSVDLLPDSTPTEVDSAIVQNIDHPELVEEPVLLQSIRKSLRQSSIPRRRYGKQADNEQQTPKSQKDKRKTSVKLVVSGDNGSPKESSDKGASSPKVVESEHTEASSGIPVRNTKSSKSGRKRKHDEKPMEPKVRKKRVKQPQVEVPQCELSELRCEFCDRSWFQSVRIYKNHVAKCASNPASMGQETPDKQVYKCEICKASSTSKYWLSRHQREVHNINNTKPPPEPKRKKSEPPQQRQCSFCGKLFMTRSSHSFHVNFRCKSNPDVRNSYRCNHCSNLFRSKELLARHYETDHPNGFQVICDICGMVFKTRGGLYWHQVKVHKERKGRYGCDRCEKTYHTSRELKQHQIIHTDERNYHCHLCSKTYRYEQHLKRHIKTFHENKHNFTCEKCGHGVEKLSYLQSHICGRVRRKASDAPLIDKDVYLEQVIKDYDIVQVENIVQDAVGQSQYCYNSGPESELHTTAASVEVELSEEAQMACIYLLDGAQINVVTE